MNTLDKSEIMSASSTKHSVSGHFTAALVLLSLLFPRLSPPILRVLITILMLLISRSLELLFLMSDGMSSFLPFPSPLKCFISIFKLTVTQSEFTFFSPSHKPAPFQGLLKWGHNAFHMFKQRKETSAVIYSCSLAPYIRCLFLVVGDFQGLNSLCSLETFLPYSWRLSRIVSCLQARDNIYNV